MEQKKKKQEDVLVVRDEKTGEISVVAGLDGKGYPNTKPAKPEHSQDFLRFDRHGDMRVWAATTAEFLLLHAIIRRSRKAAHPETVTVTD